MFGVSKFFEKLEAMFREVAATSNTQQMLQVLLAEYNALRTEIQNRSTAQNTLLQLHLTALTLILGAALSEKLGPWIVFLIPLEAAIFGVWWIDHALVIMELGAHIREFIEPRISSLLNEQKVMSWETNFQARTGVALSRRRREHAYRWLVLTTFAGPSIITIVYVALTITLSILLTNKLLPSTLLSGLNPIFSGREVWIAALFWVVDLGALGAYLSLYRHRMIKG